MFSISGATQSLGLDSQLLKSPSFGKDRVFVEDPYADKVSLSDGQQEPALTYIHLAKSNSSSLSEEPSKQNEENEQLTDTSRLANMMQQVLDAKMGIDRKKLEEIEKKIEALLSKEGELTDAEKAQLDILQKQKEQLIKESAKKLTEEAS
ncbi:hypothetical protein [Rheinheimera sp. 1928-s]|uniref:hypothetical protein n=1 Tax=Rheinheimera sp. 1928-s TaxID=3033803 RepID=UPI002630E7CA|nr:hypothetical protein [Rheinheimera sp. 1928-s]MDF3124773.1 hypothetical protein [Rheinheimera sp. 1928-s]